ncbi:MULTISPECIES: hypothetical protein [unclassified Halomonas]|nr:MULTISPECIES: hypothetical protein [unclassified Halomonas]
MAIVRIASTLAFTGNFTIASHWECNGFDGDATKQFTVIRSFSPSRF